MATMEKTKKTKRGKQERKQEGGEKIHPPSLRKPPEVEGKPHKGGEKGLTLFYGEGGDYLFRKREQFQEALPQRDLLVGYQSSSF
jgi:hypothetical protein